ncbi:MAG: preprotein translocase subunit SecG [Proteobacteria bacterium]|nr:preprotein translocase subunit SecG [Pseudomonadota bacterium]NOG59612.1 preprotein translocase subunit SecG [Pseudomonadota bacterium]
METIHTLLFVLQVLVAVALIGIILVQHGKGADAGAAFGSGSSSTVFGSQGSGNFMTKVTTVLAVIFLSNSLFLGYLATNAKSEAPTSLLDQPEVVLEQDAIEQDVPAVIEDQSEIQDSDLPSLPTE